MEYANYHFHSTGSDGKFTPEEIVNNSIENNIKYICFTDHYPLPNQEITPRPEFHKKGYYDEINSLQEKHKENENISIAFGVEMDWLEEFIDYTKKELKRRNFDFVIGSVHFLKNNVLNKYAEIHFVDNNIEDLEKECKDIKGIMKKYYGEIKKMAESGLFDTVGHLDRIKYNTAHLFSEDDEWYKEEVIKCLKAIKETGICVEINTSGLNEPSRNHTFPSRWILEEVKKMGIPITIGTDGHKHIHEKLKEGYKIAKEIGFDHVYFFKKRKKIRLDI